MKRICPRCNRVSLDGNLWCQEKYCPAENATEIFDHGEWVGNIQITKLISVQRASALYEAQRGKTHILFKVAQDGCQEKLKREARLLASFQLGKSKHPLLPILLPAQIQGTIKDFPYGKIVVNGKTRYFEVFDYIDGEPLRNVLYKNPQLWFQYVGWLVISLTDVLALMHRAGKLHLCLNPDGILIHFDKEDIPRVTLIDLGMADGVQDLKGSWDNRFTLPAYTAPELITMSGKVGPASDVYGLGLLLYEMLAGRPAYEYKVHSDEEVYTAVTAEKTTPVGRTDLKNVPEIAEKAIRNDYSLRQKDIMAFVSELQANFPQVPREKKPFKMNWRTAGVLVATALVVSLLLVMALILYLP
jgi:serine/threonine protein kinase